MSRMVLGLALLSILAFLLIIRPRHIFFLILSSVILFYSPISQGVVLFTIRSAKVYPGDVILGAISAFLVFRTLRMRFPLVPRSVRLFSLLFVWGIIAIARGIPHYGYSAVGEARWYVLSLLYYFFMLSTFKDSQQIQRLARWFLYLTLLMVPIKFVYFYLLGGKEQVPSILFEDPRMIFRFVNSTESLLIAFAMVTIILFYMFGEIGSPQIIIYGTIAVLLISLIVTQTRSVWLAAAAGLAAIGGKIALQLVRGRIPRPSLFLINAVLLLLGFASLIASQASPDIYTTIGRSASLFQDPLKDPTAHWRLVGWKQELERAMQSPLIGQGLGGYSEWFDGQQWQRVAIHNGYIMHFSKFGVIGLFLMFTGIFFWYLEMMRYARVERKRRYRLIGHAIQICTLMHLVFAFFFDFTIFFWMLLAAGTVLARKHHSDKSVPPNEVRNRCSGDEEAYGFGPC